MATRLPLRVRGIGVGSLSPNGKTATVPDPLIGADLNLALDVLADFTSQVAFDAEVLIDVATDLEDLVLGEVTDFRPGVEAELFDHL